MIRIILLIFIGTRKTLLSIVGTLIFFGCTRLNDSIVSGGLEVNLDLTEEQIDLPLSELYDSITLIPLETTDVSLIGIVSAVTLSDSMIFVGDRIEEVIQVFDWNGRYVRTIGAIGQGPGEYLTLTQIDYNSKDKCLLVYDRRNGFVISYSPEGNYLKTDSVNYFCDDFACNESGFLFVDYTSTGKDRAAVYHYNPVTKERKKISDWKSEISTGAWSRFSRNGKKITVAGPLPGSDIYDISGDSIILKYRFKVEPELTNSDLMRYRDAREPIKLDKYMLQSCVESDTNLFMVYYNGADFIRVLYDKSSGKYKLIQSMPYDLDGNKLAGLFPLHYNGARVGFVRNPDSEENPMLALFHYKNRNSDMHN